MSKSKNQNRREFLLSSGWKGLITGFGYIGTSAAKTNPVSGEVRCPDNLSCHDCYKLGVCEEHLAVQTRKDIKINYYKTKVSKGTNHG